MRATCSSGSCREEDRDGLFPFSRAVCAWRAGGGVCPDRSRRRRRPPGKLRQPRLAHFYAAAGDADRAHAGAPDRAQHGAACSAGRQRGGASDHAAAGRLLQPARAPWRIGRGLPRCRSVRASLRPRLGRRPRRVRLVPRAHPADRPGRDHRLPAVELVAAAQPARFRRRTRVARYRIALRAAAG